MNLMDRIKNKFGVMSKGQRAIAEHLLTHYESAAFLTASKLGKIVGVSESTIVRFAISLGYLGYPHMQEELQEIVRNKLSTVTRLEITAESTEAKNVLTDVLRSDIKDINETLGSISNKDFIEAVEMISKARKVFIIGNRSANALAGFLGFYLNLILGNVKVINNGMGGLFEQMLTLTQEDVVIGISFPRYTRRTVELFEVAVNQSAQTIAITDSIISPLAQMADISLTAKSQLSSFVDSMVAPLSLINAIITALGMVNQESVKKTFERLEDIWDKYDIYYHVDS